MKWDGEWQVTYEVFRDLAIAFAGALLLIYGLLVAWFGSFVTPLVMMTAIPVTLGVAVTLDPSGATVPNWPQDLRFIFEVESSDPLTRTPQYGSGILGTR